MWAHIYIIYWFVCCFGPSGKFWPLFHMGGGPLMSKLPFVRFCLFRELRRWNGWRAYTIQRPVHANIHFRSAVFLFNTFGLGWCQTAWHKIQILPKYGFFPFILHKKGEDWQKPCDCRARSQPVQGNLLRIRAKTSAEEWRWGQEQALRDSRWIFLSSTKNLKGSHLSNLARGYIISNIVLLQNRALRASAASYYKEERLKRRTLRCGFLLRKALNRISLLPSL